MGPFREFITTPELRYAVLLEPAEPDEGGYTVTVPALPEIATQGETLEEALERARDAIQLSIDYRRDEALVIPPSDADGARLEIVSVRSPAA